MNNLATIDNQSLFKLVTNGDSSQLTPEQKLHYYKARCDAAGLDPRCQPFQFIKLQGKEVLYALKACTDQLASKHGVICEVLSQVTDSGIRNVTVRARTRDGRQTDEIGCVSVEGLKGDQLCNAQMKAVTKAKRRAILSICGLGMLDETELETIPNVTPTNEAPAIALLPPEKITVDQVEEDPSPKTLAARAKAADPLSNKYLNGKWKDVEIHFGKNKGTKLSALAPRSLAWYRDEWKPKPYNGVIDDKTLELEEAIKAYAIERQIEKEREEVVQEAPANDYEPEDAIWEDDHKTGSMK